MKASLLLPYGLAATGYVRQVPAKASSGCSAEQSNIKVDTTLNVTLGDRRYLLYIPQNYQPTTPAPLVLSYHGGTHTAEFQQQLDLLSTPFFNKDYIVVYPNGINKTWQGVPNVETDDVGFTNKILDKVEAEYCIDTKRVFATGKSQGGGMVGVLACDHDLSRRVAAFAPVSGSFYVSDFGDTCQPDTVAMEPCDPGRKHIPIVDFHGKADDTISYFGGARKGGCLPTIPHWVQTWAERNELGAGNATSRVMGALNNDAVVYIFGSGKEKGLVTHVMDGDSINHDWPSTEPNSDNSHAGRHPASFNASSIILEFFEAHPLGSISSGTTDAQTTTSETASSGSTIVGSTTNSTSSSSATKSKGGDMLVLALVLVSRLFFAPWV